MLQSLSLRTNLTVWGHTVQGASSQLKMKFHSSRVTISQFKGHSFTVPGSQFHSSMARVSHFKGHRFTVQGPLFHISRTTFIVHWSELDN